MSSKLRQPEPPGSTNVVTPARKDGPSLYDVCDPVLLKYRGGDPHLGNYTVYSQDGEAGGINLLDYGCIRIFPSRFVAGVGDDLVDQGLRDPHRGAGG